MKKITSIFKVLIFCTLTFSMFSSCNKDKDTAEPDPTPTPVTNYFQYKGTKYTITKAFVLYDNVMSGSSIHINRVLLTSAGVYWDTFFEDMDGVGYAIIMDVISGSATSFTGTFQTHPEHTYIQVGDIWNGNAVFNYDFFMMEGDEKLLEQGTCTITQNGDKYTFNATMKDQDGVDVPVLFTGSVERHNMFK